MADAVISITAAAFKNPDAIFLLNFIIYLPPVYIFYGFYIFIEYIVLKFNYPLAICQPL